ncbi:MAG: GNAT family N-acetyltransferase [Ruminococcaceae bacterium]|nr:GNAT family N-acetyltransferase [Oscillospiraceae bacterium]
MAEIRLYRPGDETALSILLRRTLLEVNASHCPADEIEWLYNRYTPEMVAEIASGGHTYVMTEGETIVGTGTVVETGEAECEIIAAFLLPEAIGRGLGRKLFTALESDALCVNARRIWLTSSENALDFYEKTGWQYVYGYRQRGGELHLLEMEKRK